MNLSNQLDNQIINDAANISLPYIDLLSLVARQSMSAIEITLSKNPDGSLNQSDIMAFMVDMGNVGHGLYDSIWFAIHKLEVWHLAFSVNAVDVLYAAFPMYLYLNPDLGGYLLRPLLVAQDTSQYTQPYAAQGLGQFLPPQ